MTKKIFLLGLTLALSGAAIGCGDDDDTVPLVDAGMRDMNVDMNTDTDGGDVDMGPPSGLTCADYCTLVTTNCTAANAQYADMAECMTQCTTAAIPVGTAGMMAGNTLGCRVYHGGVAATDPATHCPHAGLSGAGVCGTVCEAYCGLIARSCTGDDQQYPDSDACLRACEVLPDTGAIGATDGDTVQCRFTHAVAAIDDAAANCDRAGATGGGTCGAALTYDFRTGASATYTQFDRMGMPAVATALIPSGRKVAYNQAAPAGDLADFAGDLLTSLSGLHTALDDDITGASLTPCSMAMGAALPICVEQSVGAGGPSVVSLVVPDTLQIDTDTPAGFPNGRKLADPVIDVTLAVILLDLSSATGCAGGPCTAGTLAALPLNPPMNDRPFSTTFPFVAAPFAVP